MQNLRRKKHGKRFGPSIEQKELQFFCKLLKLNFDMESLSWPLSSPSPTLCLDLRLSMKSREVRLGSIETFLESLLLILLLILEGASDTLGIVKFAVSPVTHKFSREYRKKYETNRSIFNHELETETSSN